jgi:hypothetical protein
MDIDVIGIEYSVQGGTESTGGDDWTDREVLLGGVTEVINVN